MRAATISLPTSVKLRAPDGRIVLDLVIAVAVAAMMLLSIEEADDYVGRIEPDALVYALSMIGSVALIWRRKAPFVVLVVVYLALVIMYLRNYGVYGAEMGLPAAYAVARFGDNRRNVWLAIPLGTAILLVAGTFGVFDLSGSNRYLNGITPATYITFATVAGVAVRNRESLFSDAEERAKQAETDRLVQAQRAVAKERRRIAREMHDIVAHGMSVIAVQAGAAQQIVHTDPAKSAIVLARIEDTARQSLAEMRRMLGVLREDDDQDVDMAPQPRLAEIADVVAQAVASGAPTELVISGSERELPPGIELAAYRITQEALTNVRKHGGKSATTVVCLDYQPDSIVVEVTDNGRGAISKLSRIGSGNGLIGMRERVEIYNGKLDAGPVRGGGYAVRAVLPLDNPTASATSMNGQQS